MASNKDTITYKIIHVPKTSPQLADIVTKTRTTRLHTLETDPTSWLSNHAAELALPISVWERRLTSPDITIFVCIATSSDEHGRDPETNLLQSEWAGFAALRGPMKYEDYYASPDMGLPIPASPEEEGRWHMYDLYTLPKHRGQGVARKLIEECVATAVKYTGGCEPALAPSAHNPEVKHARIRLFMNPKNVWLITVYENMGFVKAGKVTLAEGFRANSMDESIPANTRDTKEMVDVWHTRYGLAMEQVVKIR
jgi:ribosomal protein S18 acetylase RimI-like enzyme